MRNTERVKLDHSITDHCSHIKLLIYGWVWLFSKHTAENKCLWKGERDVCDRDDQKGICVWRKWWTTRIRNKETPLKSEKGQKVPKGLKHWCSGRLHTKGVETPGFETLKQTLEYNYECFSNTNSVALRRPARFVVCLLQQNLNHHLTLKIVLFLGRGEDLNLFQKAWGSKHSWRRQCELAIPLAGVRSVW